MPNEPTQTQATPQATTQVDPTQAPAAGGETTAPSGGNAGFSQEQVDAIIERRLARERRAHQRELDDIRRQLPTQTQQQPAAPQQPQDAREFLTEFSRDPRGTLQRFAQEVQTVQTQQMTRAQERIQNAAQEALENLGDRYPDFNQVSEQVIRHIQSNPGLSKALRLLGDQVTPDVYEGILDLGYRAVKDRMDQQVVAAGTAQVQTEAAQLSAQKAQAAAPTPGTSQPAPQETDPEEALFQAHKASLRRL